METTIPAKRPRSTAAAVTTAPVRVSKETRKRILAELARLNKKDFGRAVKPDELIALALTLIEQKHHAQLQEATLSNADRLQLRYLAYVKEHGSISKDAFLGKLMEGGSAAGTTSNPPIQATEKSVETR